MFVNKKQNASKTSAVSAVLRATDMAETLTPGPWDHIFVSANGCRFHVAYAAPNDEANPLEKPLVLLLPGLAQNWWSWREFIPAFVDAGYRVAAVDLRGTGASDKPPSGYQLQSLAADIVSLIHALGAKKAILVGSSIGGIIASASRSLFPEAVTAVVSLSVAFPPGGPFSRNEILQDLAVHRVGKRGKLAGYRKLTDTPDAIRDLLSIGKFLPLTSEELTHYQTALTLPFGNQGLALLMQGIFSSNNREVVSAQKKARKGPQPPMLLLTGDNDRFLQSELVIAQAKRLDENLNHEKISNAGHYLQEDQPRKCKEIIFNWLQKR